MTTRRVNRMLGRAMARGPFLFTMAVALAAPPATLRAQTETKETEAEEQPEQPVTAQSHPNNPELWNVEQMMEDAVIQISRRYNLNDAQTEYTRLLLIERTMAFLEVHEAEVRTLLRESIDLRMGKMAGTPGALKDWAERAMPVYEAAENAILQGNEEWREILDPEQIKIHDADMAAMRANFRNVTRMLNGWKESDGSATALAQGANPQQATGLEGGGKIDAQTARVSNPPQPVIRQHVEDVWADYVKRFIKVYQLDDKQANAALEGIYQDIHQQAVKYRETNKSRFAAIERGEADADSGDRRTKLTAQRRELEEPLNRMFIKLDARLKDLLSNRQLAAVDPKGKKDLEALYNTLAGVSSKQRDKAVAGKPKHRASARNAGEEDPADSEAEEKNEDSETAAPSKPKKPAIAD